MYYIYEYDTIYIHTHKSLRALDTDVPRMVNTIDSDTGA